MLNLRAISFHINALKKSIVIFAAVPVFLISSSVFAQSRANDQDDFLISTNGDTIQCVIDNVTKSGINYHIKSKGFDKKDKIATNQILSYRYKQKWYTGDGYTLSSGSLINWKARNFILNENFNDAILLYSKLLEKDTLNPELLAEDAYLLALAGIYDAALMRIDRYWSMGSNTADANYFAAQTFALMGFDDLAAEFWKPSDKIRTPTWIETKSLLFLQKYKRNIQNKPPLKRTELIADFKRANELAAKNSYFRSIALFREISMYYPNEYLPYVGYSISLEKTGAYKKSAESVEKALSLIGNKTDDITKKQFLEQRLTTVKKKMPTGSDYPLPGMVQSSMLEEYQPQMMAYAGGMIGKSLTSINCRVGYFVSGSGNASLDFGVTSNSKNVNSILGISFYEHQKIFVSGAGLQMYSGQGKSSFVGKISIGISLMNKKKSSSFDVFLDANKGFEKDAVTVFNLSIGTSFYFGKRK